MATGISDRSTRVLVTRSAEETEAAGKRLARTLERGDLVLLAGSLGAGKTTFVRGVAEGLGVNGAVASPTFQLVRIHGPGPRGLALAHLDLYRLEEEMELADLGLDELLEQGVALVEWGDRLQPAAWMARAGRLRIELLDESSRQLCLEEGPSTWSL